MTLGNISKFSKFALFSLTVSHAVYFKSVGKGTGYNRRRAESWKRQKAEDRIQKTEYRIQKTEYRRQNTGDRRQRTEGRGQKAERTEERTT